MKQMETLNAEYKSLDKALKNMYIEWLNELRETHPEFMGERYSNPYYTSVPKGWIENEKRILVVGEEGHGSWGCGKKDGIPAEDFDYIQTFNWSYMASNIGDGSVEYWLYPNAYKEKRNPSPFWRRFRKVSEYGVCAWSNLDKIHYLEGRCKLSDKDKRNIHSVTIKVLAEEIKILKPTHVIFFGWYGISLEAELPDVHKKLYDTDWEKNVKHIPEKSISYIFAYHPGWHAKEKPAGYEDKVLEILKSTM